MHGRKGSVSTDMGVSKVFGAGGGGTLFGIPVSRIFLHHPKAVVALNPKPKPYPVKHLWPWHAKDSVIIGKAVDIRQRLEQLGFSWGLGMIGIGALP